MPRCKYCPDGHAKVGDFVQSRYQAKWSGTVLEEVWVKRGWNDSHEALLLRVRQEIDRLGNPIRNRKSVKYSACFFCKVAKVDAIAAGDIAVGGTTVSVNTSPVAAVDPLL